MNVKKLPIVMVKYTDVTELTNFPLEELKNATPKTIIVFGYLFESNPTVKLIKEFDESDLEENDLLIIPKENVISMKELGEKK